MSAAARRKAILQFYRLRRATLGKSQQEVGSEAGIPQTKLSRIEHGWAFPDATTRRALARALKCAVADIPAQLKETPADGSASVL